MNRQFDYSHLEEDSDDFSNHVNNNTNNGRLQGSDTTDTNPSPRRNVLLSTPDSNQHLNSDSDTFPQNVSPSYSDSDYNYDYDSSHSHSSNVNRSNTSGSGPASPKSNSIRYTALRPTRVVEEGADGDDGVDDGDDFNSHVHLDILNTQHRKRKFRRFHVLICVLLTAAAIIVAFCLLYTFVFFPSTDGKVVYPDGKLHTADLARLQELGKNVAVTSCGLVRGKHEDGAYVFKGIPYALPPTGKRRWKAPVLRSYDRNTCWKDVLNATQFGNKCVQPSFSDSDEIEGEEDCLFLNIWTPSLKPANNFPVMVWLHSGDLIHGSGHMPGMSPSAEIAKATGAVYVSLNYRLGVFGFLALDVLREGRERHAGNYGIMDQHAALLWIRDNIRHFGGNEFNITIFGHGSGATSIEALLSSHWSHGLFHKAWLSSPVAIVNKTLDEACRDNRDVLTKAKCSSASCLRSLSAKSLVKASPWPLEPYWTLDQVFETPSKSQIRNGLVIFDGHTVTWSSEKEGPIGVDVPVVLGTTYFEISGLLSEKKVVSLTEDDFNDLLVHYVSVFGTDTVIQLKRLYSNLPHLHYTSPVQFPPHSSASFAHLIGDVKNVCPLKLLATAIEYVYSSPVYMYAAEIYPSHNILLSSTETNSFVGWDLLAFFDGFQHLSFRAGQGDINFRNLMRSEIMGFVKKGKPISTRWKTVGENTGIIEKGVTVRPAASDYFDHCKFWDRHKFFRYSWRDTSDSP